MKTRIITISRQFGSGGREIGKMLAERFGMAYYDKELIEKVHEETGFSEKFIEEQGEYSPSNSFLSYAFIGRDTSGYSMNDHVWNAQRKIILEAAEKEPCVIVGRCADYILGDRDDVFNVFIHADFDFRSDRLIKEFGDIEGKLEEILKDKDRKRQINYRYYTDRKWGECQNYDLCLNSGRIGIEKCVDVIAQILEDK